MVYAVSLSIVRSVADNSPQSSKFYNRTVLQSWYLLISTIRPVMLPGRRNSCQVLKAGGVSESEEDGEDDYGTMHGESVFHGRIPRDAHDPGQDGDRKWHHRTRKT